MQPNSAADAKRPRSRPLLVGFSVLVAVLFGFLAVKSAGSSKPPTSPTTTPATISAGPSTSSNSAHSTVPATPAPTLAPGSSLIATASRSTLLVYAAPSATSRIVLNLPNPWFVTGDTTDRVPQVLGVAAGHAPAGWVHVVLPVRPNGSTGWVQAQDVTETSVPFHVVVHLATHQLVVTQGTSILLTDTVAIGAPATPTPPGHYYVRVLFQAPDPNTVYGPWDFGLSAHSDALTTFEGSDAEIGIHGNNDASVLGSSVTHGCVRMSNAGITRLSGILPLGTPVDILAQ